MSLALSAIIILLFLLPGITFRISYLKTDSLQYSIDSSIGGEAAYILLTSFLLQVFGLLFFNVLDSQAVIHGLKIVIAILVPDTAGSLDELTESNLNDSLWHFFKWGAYILFLIVLAWGFGVLLRKFVLWTRLDYVFPFLKVSSQWWYLLEGRDIKVATGDDFDFVQIDVLVGGQDGDYLYCGILKCYFFKQNKLDKLHLRYAYRRKLNAQEIEESHELFEEHKGDLIDSGQQVDEALEEEIKYKIYESKFDERFSRVYGDDLVIPYATVKNLNVSFIKIDLANGQNSI